MISCPNCRATLPQGVGECQFCGLDVSRAYRPVDRTRHAQVVNESSGLVWFWYSVIAVFWIADGIYMFGSGVGLIGASLSAASVAIGAFLTVTGIGLLVRNEVFRSHYMALCFIALCAGVWTAIDGSRTVAANMGLGYFLCALGAVRALSAGMMARLTGKTTTKLAR